MSHQKASVVSYRYTHAQQKKIYACYKQHEKLDSDSFDRTVIAQCNPKRGRKTGCLWFGLWQNRLPCVWFPLSAVFPAATRFKCVVALAILQYIHSHDVDLKLDRELQLCVFYLWKEAGVACSNNRRAAMICRSLALAKQLTFFSLITNAFYVGVVLCNMWWWTFDSSTVYHNALCAAWG
jgi:hypothetical protein